MEYLLQSHVTVSQQIRIAIGFASNHRSEPPQHRATGLQTLLFSINSGARVSDSLIIAERVYTVSALARRPALVRRKCTSSGIFSMDTILAC